MLDSLEMGMPIARALGDVAYSADAVRETAELMLDLTAPAGATVPGTLTYNAYEPLGIVAVISPWNFPVNQVLVNLIPALAMGNSVVLKPSEIATASALVLADLLHEAGLPKGVLSVLTGPGAPTGEGLAQHPAIACIAFTGSTRTAARIQATCASQSGVPKRMLLELGGKSPHIVCQSFADLEPLAPLLAENVFGNSGQVCSAGTRLLVHADHASALIEAVRECAGQDFAMGDPLDPATQLGPLASENQARGVRSMMEEAEAAGLALECGGASVMDGCFAQPTIFAGLNGDEPIATQEIFGPVLGISTFNSAQEAVALANASGYGLVANIWTRDLEEGLVLSREVRSAAVGVSSSAPPSGEMARSLGLEPAGNSGFGADYGFEALRKFSQLKLITLSV